jgi:membrane protein DedA with SNARE-associated domain
VEDFLKEWDYIGVFLGIIATGLGFPMPEELPVIIGGGLVHDLNATYFRWWRMLLACIAGVIVGDTCLYLIGRLWGTRLARLDFVKKYLLPPERMHKISENFQVYGVKILLFARLTPGIRAPIFVTAGITRLPVAKFLLADGIYAIPGVTILFTLAYGFTESMLSLLDRAEKVRPFIVVVVLLGVAGYFVYRHLRKPVVEGSPKEMPPVVGPVTNRIEQTLEHTLETMKVKILHPTGDSKPGTPATDSRTTGIMPSPKAGAADGPAEDNGQPVSVLPPETAENGQAASAHPPHEDARKNP